MLVEPLPLGLWHRIFRRRERAEPERESSERESHGDETVHETAEQERQEGPHKELWSVVHAALERSSVYRAYRLNTYR